MRIMKVLLVVVLMLGLAGGVALAKEEGGKGKPQTVCPVMGGTINKELYVDYQGQRVYFCCPACVEPFKKEPEKYLKKMKEQGVTPEKSPGGK
jgi:YHS domain-containing protein